MAPSQIPLFPLEAVLFPRMAFPLHIFEPRYKLMVARCLDEKLEFGVVLARNEGIAEVGCTAAILRLLRKYPDGRMDILTEGKTAFRILQVLEEKPYHEAKVEYLAEDADEAGCEFEPGLLELYARCHTLVHAQPPDPIQSRPGTSLAFQIAANLPFDLEMRQSLLESRLEGERQSRLVEQLKQWIPRLVHQREMREKARGNGQGTQ